MIGVLLTGDDAIYPIETGDLHGGSLGVQDKKMWGEMGTGRSAESQDFVPC